MIGARGRKEGRRGSEKEGGMKATENTKGETQHTAACVQVGRNAWSILITSGRKRNDCSDQNCFRERNRAPKARAISHFPVNMLTHFSGSEIHVDPSHVDPFQETMINTDLNLAL